MISFTEVQDRLLKAQREHPAAQWPECLIRRQEARAMVLEVHRAAREQAKRG